MSQPVRVFRPPSESQSLIIRLSEGCPHNQCTFCGMYRNSVFRKKNIEEITSEIVAASDSDNSARTIFLADGNSIILPTNELIEVLGLLYSQFPKLNRVTIYGSPQYIVKKSAKELKMLKDAGLNRIHSGMESGFDPILKQIEKGTTSEETLRAFRRVKDCKIELHIYMIIGIGGKTLSRKHAIHSAGLINESAPDAIHLRVFYPLANTPMYKKSQNKSFNLLKPYEVLLELETFVSSLDTTGNIFSDHVSNYIFLSGSLPEDKNKLLEIISQAYKKDEKDLLPYFFGRKMERC